MRNVRVLVADDSVTMRAALRTLLELDSSIDVVGEARDGEEAVELASVLAPDVITMDVLMPRLNGLEATGRIMAKTPARILLVCAVGDSGGVDLSFRAMDIGALELIAKPSWHDLTAWGAALRQTVRLMAEVPVVRRWRAPTSVAPPPLKTAPQRAVVGIVASTGGPPALAQLLSQLPSGLPASFLVAQHMAQGFTSGLHRWLVDVSSLPVHIAESGSPLALGAVYLAPDGQDLELGRDQRIAARTPRSSHTPSGDRLLESIALAAGTNSVGMILTGMGDDGVRGLRAIRAAGGRTLVQDEASSVVYGMPRAAAEAQLADYVASLDVMPALIVDMVAKERK